ncbi:hypothetical protein AK812_SmicGene23188 [Symbiodinium microadriaticum]|uniref:Uncharacterized protein n=1 Tax=Symbiodinium microadriaticum TaxID=2951 RepID=A0A1Q9DHU3_SYMMI|nr:hypothetical protein AK812_SmicGene23188 [Symbiodinium microadriaticum]
MSLSVTDEKEKIMGTKGAFTCPDWPSHSHLLHLQRMNAERHILTSTFQTRHLRKVTAKMRMAAALALEGKFDVGLVIKFKTAARAFGHLQVAAQIRREAQKAEQEAVRGNPKKELLRYALNLVKAAGLDWEEAERLVDMVALIPVEFMIVYQYLLDVLEMPLVVDDAQIKASRPKTRNFTAVVQMLEFKLPSLWAMSMPGLRSVVTETASRLHVGVAHGGRFLILSGFDGEAMKTQAGLWDPKAEPEVPRSLRLPAADHSEESELVVALEADKVSRAEVQKQQPMYGALRVVLVFDAQ